MGVQSKARGIIFSEFGKQVKGQRQLAMEAPGQHFCSQSPTAQRQTRAPVGCAGRSGAGPERLQGGGLCGRGLGTVATPRRCHPPPQPAALTPPLQTGAQSKPQSKEAGEGVRKETLSKLPGVARRQVPKPRDQHHGQRPRTNSGPLGRRGLLAGLAAL